MSALWDTSRHLRQLGLRQATLLVDRARAEANIARFAARARAANVILRPHFKTHQSAAVADWFRRAGVRKATVSSIGMARYFADHGWSDLTLAIGANPLEADLYDALAGRIRLGLTVDAVATVDLLLPRLRRVEAFWIEVDTGQGRGGVPWADHAALVAVARRLGPGRLAGLLTHGGHSYGGPAARVFGEVRTRMQAARSALVAAGLPAVPISAGDTPGFAASEDWNGLDEARPGNFVFYDLMQLQAGACGEDDLACAVACPVIGVYPARGELLVHAGAVHLSCEHLDGTYGRLLQAGPPGFGRLLEGWAVRGLSQEHGRLAAESTGARAELQRLAPGDLVLIAPVHACLTCEQFARYWTLAGEELPRYGRTC